MGPSGVMAKGVSNKNKINKKEEVIIRIQTEKRTTNMKARGGMITGILKKTMILYRRAWRREIIGTLRERIAPSARTKSKMIIRTPRKKMSIRILRRVTTESTLSAMMTGRS